MKIAVDEHVEIARSAAKRLDPTEMEESPPGYPLVSDVVPRFGYG
jgi:hypothetical protein